ncbi:MAG: hypothetical protein JSW26_12165, partial [Desulfobacterales bacterium]
MKRLISLSNALRMMGAVSSAVLLVVFMSVGTATAADLAKCEALADMKIENTNFLSSTVVPAADGAPEYCRVLG